MSDESSVTLHVEPCPRCDHGSIMHYDGPSWWEVRKLRCHWCQGTGKVLIEHDAQPEGESQ